MSPRMKDFWNSPWGTTMWTTLAVLVVLAAAYGLGLFDVAGVGSVD